MKPEEAQAALQFMQRITLQPQEIQAYQQVCIALTGIANQTTAHPPAAPAAAPTEDVLPEPEEPDPVAVAGPSSLYHYACPRCQVTVASVLAPAKGLDAQLDCHSCGYVFLRSEKNCSTKQRVASQRKVKPTDAYQCPGCPRVLHGPKARPPNAKDLGRINCPDCEASFPASAGYLHSAA